MAAPIDSLGNSQNQNIIDDLEASFVNCLSLLTTQEVINVQDAEETKTSIENAMQRFLELSRQTEAFFLRKRMLISFQKPAQLLSDDITDLRAELVRKEQLLERHSERLKRCQMILQQQAGVSSQSIQPPQSQPHQSPVQPTMQPPQVSHPLPPQPHLGQPGTLPQYPTHHMQQMPTQGLPQYQAYPGAMHPQSMPGPPPPMPPHSVAMASRPQPPPSYPQGPLAYLEQTTSSIGLPERR